MPAKLLWANLVGHRQAWWVVLSLGGSLLQLPVPPPLLRMLQCGNAAMLQCCLIDSKQAKCISIKR